MTTLMTMPRPEVAEIETDVPTATAVDVVRSEWTKLRTVASTRWTLLAAWVGTIGIGLIVSAAVASRWSGMSAADRASFDPTFRSLTGILLGQLAIGILGVLVITSEYATGMIRSTFAAVPARRTVLGAKALVLAVPTLIIGVTASLIAFLGGQALLASTGVGVSLAGGGELRAVIGGGVYLMLLGLLALGLGSIFRRAAGGIGAFVGLVLVLPAIVSALPNPWGRDISEFLPGNAGQAFMQVHSTSGSLSPWVGLLVLVAWVAAALGGALWLIGRRDA
jgi:hypothetical protein